MLLTFLKTCNNAFQLNLDPFLHREGSARTQQQAALKSHVQVAVSVQGRCLRGWLFNHFCCTRDAPLSPPHADVAVHTQGAGTWLSGVKQPGLEDFSPPFSLAPSHCANRGNKNINPQFPFLFSLILPLEDGGSMSLSATQVPMPPPQAAAESGLSR